MPRCRITSKKRFSLPELTLTGQPGEEALGEHEMPIARNREKLSDSLNHAQDQRFQPRHQVPPRSRKSVAPGTMRTSALAAETGQCNPNIAQAAVDREDHGEPGEPVTQPPEDGRF